MKWPLQPNYQPPVKIWDLLTSPGASASALVLPRALYHDPAVLVLDEATSSLDTETERCVMQAVRALQCAKTILILAHRFSTVEHCDRMYRLEQGSVVEEGSPGAMLSLKKMSASK